MNNNKIATFSILALTIALTSGCATVVDEAYNKTENDVSSVKAALDSNRAASYSAVKNVSGLWLGGEAFKVSAAETAPSVLKRNVSFAQPGLVSVGELLTLLSSSTGIKMVMSQDAVDYTSGAAPGGSAPTPAPSAPPSPLMTAGLDASTELDQAQGAIKFSLPEYKGTVTNLLGLIASKSGLFWSFEKGEVVFKRNVTKNYLVDMSPGSVDYTAEMKSDLATSSSSTDTSTSEGSIHTIKTEIKTDSTWAVMNDAIKTMLSPGGSVTIQASLGMVTVTDTPQVQSRVASFIKSSNSISSKQIAVRSDVYEITSNDDGEFDTDITALYDFKGVMNLGLSDSTLTLSKGDGGHVGNNSFKDASAGVKLLRTNKNASLVTSSTIYAMNGQATPFQQMDEIGYVQEVSVTQAGDSGGEPVRSITPGKTSQGYSMMVMPRVLSDGRVMMNLAVDSSRINSIEEYGDDNSGRVQLPNRSTNKYQQVVTVKSGSPLMIAGVDRTEKSANIESLAGKAAWMFGGSQKGSKRKVMTMIVLTPYIMEK